MKLFIDDIRTPYDETWILARDAMGANALLDGVDFDTVSFDNDLGDADAPEGIHVLQRLEEGWVVDGKRKPREIRVHTANSVAKGRMDALLVANGYRKAGSIAFNTSDTAWVYYFEE